MTADLHLNGADYPALVTAWLSGIEPFADLAESLTAEEWHAPSVLPGWSNGDIVAHVVGIERDLLGAPTPAADLPWEELPHAADPFSRYTELAVAQRRGCDPLEVCAELRKTIAERRLVLAAEPGALGEIVRGPGGWELPRGIVIRMRCFDIWVHDQDIRTGVGRPGDLDTDAAWVAAERMLHGLGFVWARKVGAAPGQAAAVTVTGPGVHFATTVVMGDNGRAALVSLADAEAQTAITVDWPTFAALASGRTTPAAAEALIEGDTDLGRRLLEHLNVAP